MEHRNEDLSRMIYKLIDVLHDPESQYTNKSKVVGVLGKLYVKQLLSIEGERFVHRGNQSKGADIELFPIANDKRFKNLKYVFNAKKFEDNLINLDQYNICVKLLKNSHEIKINDDRRLVDHLTNRNKK